MSAVISDTAQFIASGLAKVGCELRGSSKIVLEPGSSFECGENTVLYNARIAVKRGGRFSIGSGGTIKGVVMVEAESQIIIGDRLLCNMAVDIRAAEGRLIQIGHDCLFADPRIYNSDFHAIYDMEQGLRINAPRDIRIGDHVWLAMNSLVLKGSDIGNDTVVGAGAVVSGTHPPNVILSGNPVTVRKRNITWSNRIDPLIAVKPRAPGPVLADPVPADRGPADPVPADPGPDLVPERLTAQISKSTETPKSSEPMAGPAVPLSAGVRSDPATQTALVAPPAAIQTPPAGAPAEIRAGTPADIRAGLQARIAAMQTDYRRLMEDCVAFGKGDPAKFIDMGIPQSQLFMVELLPFIHRAYLSAPTNALRSVLDIGPQSFGGTRLLHELHNARTHNKLKLQITAVDIVRSFELLQQLMVPEIEFLIQDIFSIKDRAWDFVICSHVIEHVPDPLPFLARCQELARDFVLVACPWKEFPITTKGHVNTIDNALVKAAGGQELTIYRNYMWGKQREVCIFKLKGKARH